MKLSAACSTLLSLGLSVRMVLAGKLVSRACTPYLNAVTNANQCCDASTSLLYITDNVLNLGICCPFGSILDGLVCVSPPPATTGGVNSGDPVCPSKAGQDLGIKYGSCYVLQGLTGDYLGHDYNTKYEILGENPGVVLRVCGDTTNCATKAGSLVTNNGTWYLQDQFGDPSGTGFGWLGGSGDLTVGSAANALIVAGSELSYGGKCSICITFPPGGAHAPCPLQPGQSHLGVASNPNACQPFIWQEVGCRSEK